MCWQTLLAGFVLVSIVAFVCVCRRGVRDGQGLGILEQCLQDGWACRHGLCGFGQDGVEGATHEFGFAEAEFSGFAFEGCVLVGVGVQLFADLGHVDITNGFVQQRLRLKP